MKLKLLSVFAIIVLFASCGSRKDVTYMQNAETLTQEALKHSFAPVNPVVMPGDLIDIIVSGINIDAVKPFNRHDLMSQIGTSSSSSEINNSPSYYLVDEDGYIEFPVLGRLHIGGMNKDQISSLLIDGLYPKYLSDKPTIDIRFSNFKVTVLGEVKSPGMVKATNERLNILEAIASAGDLTINGVRDNVMLIRTNADGSREIHRINLKNKDLVLSPYYNLQQNDIIYVEPNSSKARQSFSIPPALSLVTSSVGLITSIVSLVFILVDR